MIEIEVVAIPATITVKSSLLVNLPIYLKLNIDVNTSSQVELYQSIYCLW